jgi:oxygen-independent coproporphyrinogen-3 oxidase
MVDCIVQEIHLTEFPLKGLKTLYFGGGTPSLLNLIQLKKIFEAINASTQTADLEEITLECNPEDMTRDKLMDWQALGINRLSIGLQSLSNAELLAMNRNHSAEDSIMAIKQLEDSFNFRVSVDLIYGTPWKSSVAWEEELKKVLQHPHIQHLSAYALSTEPKTRLSHEINNGTVMPADDSHVVEQFEILQREIERAGWDAYEISNYCKPGFRALHNSNYWKFQPYYGIGPSAHSFNGENLRYVTIANNHSYMQSIEKQELPRTYETLDGSSMLNERLMTGLRTSEGIQLSTLTQFQPQWFENNRAQIEQFERLAWLNFDGKKMRLSEAGKLVSDHIISELMWV